MSAFQYANNPATTLAGAVTAGATSIVVASGATFPTRGKFTIIVDTEIMLVTGVSGTTWTVQRGKESTSAAAHNNNAVVTGILTRDSFLGSRGLDARSYGAIGDGSTDDTAALQAALDDLASTDASGLYIPEGTYKITAALSIGAIHGKKIEGAGRESTVIRQHTDNVAIVKTGQELIHSVRFGEMALEYANTQPAANTGAIALNFTAPGAGVGNGWFYWRVYRLMVRKANKVIGISGSGSLPVWNCTFEQIRSENISQSVIYLNSPVAIGMPVNTFRNITHLTNAIAPSGAAVVLVACEASFDGLDIEDWTGQVLSVSGGAPCVVRGFHVERGNLSSTTPMIEVANDSLILEGINLGLEVTGGVAARLFRIDTGGSLHVKGGRATVTLTSGTITGLEDNGRPFEVQDVAMTNVTLPTTGRGTAFPTGIASGSRFLRTDRNIEYFYDGTRWLSTALYTHQIPIQKAVVPLTANNLFLSGFPHPTFNIYVETLFAAMFVTATNSSVNYWTATLSSGGVLSTQGNAPDAWIQESGSVAAVVTQTALLFVSFAKVGTPGDLQASIAFTYRLVG